MTDLTVSMFDGDDKPVPIPGEIVARLVYFLDEGREDMTWLEAGAGGPGLSMLELKGVQDILWQPGTRVGLRLVSKQLEERG